MIFDKESSWKDKGAWKLIIDSTIWFCGQNCLRLVQTWEMLIKMEVTVDECVLYGLQHFRFVDVGPELLDRNQRLGKG